MKSRKHTGKEVSLTIERMGGNGAGIAHCDEGKVFIGKTAPGDLVRVDLEAENENGFYARLLAVEKPGPERIEPPCPYFGPISINCGGCAAQHVTQEFYRAWKTNNVKEVLARAGVEAQRWEEPVFPPAAQNNKNGRRRTSMTAYKGDKDIRLGYNAARSHQVVDVAHCLVLAPGLDEKMQGLRPYLPDLLPAHRAVDIMLQDVNGAFDMVLSGAYQDGGKFSLRQHEAMAELSEKLDIARISWRLKEFSAPEILFARKSVVKKFGGLAVEIPPGAFLQASADGENALVSIVLKYVGDAKNVADLFCGCGTFTGPMADRNIFAADGDAYAVNALSKAAAAHKNITVRRRNLFRDPLSAEELGAFDAVVFDPPRAGGREQAMELAKSNVEKIIAVSCNPSTFARDAKILQGGGYALKSLTLVDQFVYSAHVEIAALFTR